MGYTLHTFDMFDLFFERNETTDLPELLFSTILWTTNYFAPVKYLTLQRLSQAHSLNMNNSAPFTI